LNAAVEAAHTAKSGSGSKALATQVRNSAEHNAGRTAPGGSTPPTIGNGGASTAESEVQARLWQESLERLRRSLGAACGATLPIDLDGRLQAENARPQPAATPVPVLAPRRRRSQPSQRTQFDHGP
jgi:hypothetical protein